MIGKQDFYVFVLEPEPCFSLTFWNCIVFTSCSQIKNYYIIWGVEWCHSSLWRCTKNWKYGNLGPAPGLKDYISHVASGRVLGSCRKYCNSPTETRILWHVNILSRLLNMLCFTSVVAEMRCQDITTHRWSETWILSESYCIQGYKYSDEM